MASIRERPRADGSTAYLVQYRMEDGRQGGLTFDDGQKATAFKAAVEAHGARRACEMYDINPEPRRQTADDITVGQWIRRHIDHLTGVEQYTIDVYNWYLKNDIQPTLGDIPLASLQGEDIAGWVKQMEREPSPKTGRVVTSKTIRNRHGFLASALDGAVKKKLISYNPAVGQRLPRKTSSDDDHEKRMLSRDEFNRLLNAGTVAYWKPLIEFMVSSGARWGEVSSLKPSDVDRSARTVRIRRAWKRGSKGRHIGATKTARSKRVINMPKRVLDQLDYSKDWLFTNTRGQPLIYSTFKDAWDRAVNRADLDPKPTPHDLRHTCASWMLAAGVPITTVSRHLGHENIQTTVDTYTDVDRTAFAAAADVMGQLLE